jgi:2-succinyl-6-hydroxy-2,4-cyclohexadiene-1-carboxylate synthase
MNRPPTGLHPLEHAGVSGAPFVVALHGFTGNGADFAPLAQAWPELNWLAPNLPGHARDPHAPEAPKDDCSLQATLRYLDSVAASTAHKPKILLGYSLGGRLALHWALAQPNRWAALVLIGGSAGLTNRGDRAARKAQDEALARQILSGGVAAFLDEWRQRPLIATQAQLPASWLRAMDANRAQLRAEGLAASLRGCGRGELESVEDRLAELSLPVLWCAGAEDEKYAALANQMAARCPRGESFIVPQAGHMAHLENCSAFAQGLRAFLQKHQLWSADARA